jgi:hypothetical protein
LLASCPKALNFSTKRGVLWMQLKGISLGAEFISKRCNLRDLLLDLA